MHVDKSYIKKTPTHPATASVAPAPITPTPAVKSKFSAKQKKMAGIIACAVLAIAVIGGTIAWLTSQDQKDNVFSFGEVKAELIEERWEKETLVEDPETNFKRNENLIPGSTVIKDPVLANVGTVPAYAFMEVQVPTVGDKEIFTYEVPEEWEEVESVPGEDEERTFIIHRYRYTKDEGILPALGDGNTLIDHPECKTTSLFKDDTITVEFSLSNNDWDTISSPEQYGTWEAEGEGQALKSITLTVPVTGYMVQSDNTSGWEQGYEEIFGKAPTSASVS